MGLAISEGVVQDYIYTLERLALAKAEAAEKTGYNEGYRDAMDSLGEPARSLTDLRARIEALAAEWEEYGTYPQMLPELRALLQPAKPESALGVLTEIEHWWNVCSDGDLGEKLTKLRKLLEAASPHS